MHEQMSLRKQSNIYIIQVHADEYKRRLFKQHNEHFLFSFCTRVRYDMLNSS